MKQVAALASVGSAVVLVSLKIFLTVATGSLGVLSEAMHSSLDLIAAVITYLSVRVSDRPADADHPYGHGKVENFSAFVETGLLLLTALYIIFEALQRLFFREVSIRPSAAGHRAFWAWPWESTSFVRGHSVGPRGATPAKRSKPTRSTSPPMSGARWWSCSASARFGWASARV